MKQNLWICVALGLLLLVQGLPHPTNEDDDYQLEDPERDNSPNDDGDEASGPAPILLSTNETFIVDVGKSFFRLPCKIDNPDSASVLWWMNSDILWSDKIPMSSRDHPNFKLEHDHSMVINNVQTNDSATFTCEVVYNQIKQNVKYTVKVAAPPKVTGIVSNTLVNLKDNVIEKGSPLTLTCEASGYPTPVISWTKKTRHSEDRLEGTKVSIDMVNRRHSGTYQCTATNSRGESDVKSIDIQVLYEPEVESDHEVVYGREGYETELTCIVHAEPKAKVTWLKDDQLISKTNHRISVADKGNRHQLRITGTVKSDFGVYRCNGENVKGSNSKTITLSGKPTKPIFSSAEEDPRSKSPILSWSIDSFTPITSYELMYREQDKGEWKPVDVEIDSPSTGENNRFTARHTLNGLKPGIYQAQLRAKNEFGWSELSDPHTFPGSVDKSDDRVFETAVLLEPLSNQEQNTAAQLRVSLALIISLLVARYYC